MRLSEPVRKSRGKRCLCPRLLAPNLDTIIEDNRLLTPIVLYTRRERVESQTGAQKGFKFTIKGAGHDRKGKTD